MPNRIDDIFARLRADHRKALMPFVCGGYPALSSTAAVLPALQRAGASVVEVGIPFSDPIADGPVIAAAMHEALALGATPLQVFDQVASVRAHLTLGLVAMCSVSIVQKMGGGKDGPAAFCKRARAAGFDGLIVPDVPLEESAPIRAAAAASDLTCSLLIAPTTPPARVAAITKACTGFVYLLARTGITGERSDAPDVSGLVAQIRGTTSLPVACGFGISTPDQVRAVVGLGEPNASGATNGGADAAIVGSALVRRMGDAHKSGRDPISEAETFIRNLATALS